MICLCLLWLWRRDCKDGSAARARTARRVGPTVLRNSPAHLNAYAHVLRLSARHVPLDLRQECKERIATGRLESQTTRCKRRKKAQRFCWMERKFENVGRSHKCTKIYSAIGITAHSVCPSPRPHRSWGACEARFLAPVHARCRRQLKMHTFLV